MDILTDFCPLKDMSPEVYIETGRRIIGPKILSHPSDNGQWIIVSAGGCISVNTESGKVEQQDNILSAHPTNQGIVFVYGDGQIKLVPRGGKATQIYNPPLPRPVFQGSTSNEEETVVVAYNTKLIAINTTDPTNVVVTQIDCPGRSFMDVTMPRGGDFLVVKSEDKSWEWGTPPSSSLHILAPDTPSGTYKELWQLPKKT